MINVPHATQTPLLGSQKDCCPESHITFQRFASVIRHFFIFFCATLDVLEIASEAVLVAVIMVIMLEIRLGDTWPPQQAQ